MWAEPRGLCRFSRKFLWSVHSSVFCWQIPGWDLFAWDQGSIKLVSSCALAQLAAVCDTSVCCRSHKQTIKSGLNGCCCLGPNGQNVTVETQRGCSLAGSKVKDQVTSPRWLKVTLVEERCSTGSTPPEGGGVRGVCCRVTPVSGSRPVAQVRSLWSGSMNVLPSKQEVVLRSKDPGPNIVVLLLSQHFCHCYRCRSNLVFTSVYPQTCSRFPATERHRRRYAR